MNAFRELCWLEQRVADVPAGDEWLTETERSQLQRLQVEKRRSDWRLGRWTAKCAVAGYLHWPIRRFDRIEIRSGPSGAPEVVLPDDTNPPAISVSHSAGVGMCLVGPAGASIGCDLEFVEPRSDQFLETYFTECEIAQLKTLSKEELPVAVNVIWSAKESFLKATHDGLRRDTRDVEIAIGPCCNPDRLQIEDITSREWLEFSVHSYSGNACGRWRLEQGMVRTVVYL